MKKTAKIEYRIVLRKSKAIVSTPFPTASLAQVWINGCLTGPRSLYGVQKYELRPIGRIK